MTNRFIKLIALTFLLITSTAAHSSDTRDCVLGCLAYPGADVITNERNNPQVHNLSTNTWFTSLDEAVSNAGQGDILELYSASYYEEVTVDKELTIRSATGEDPVLDGTGLRSGTGLLITATGVLIQGISFTGYDFAVDITATGEATVMACRFLGNAGMAVRNQNNNYVTDATSNWWGHETGPCDGNDDRPANGFFNPFGLGDPVGNGVEYYPWISDEDNTDHCVGLGIYNTSCAAFEVRASPNSDMSGYLTNLVFTVTWDAAEPVTLQNISSGYNISLQYIADQNGKKYAVFALEIPTEITWIAGGEYTVLAFSHNEGGAEFATSPFDIAMDSWAWDNNAYYYLEYWGSVYTGLVSHYEPEVYLGSCNLQVRANVLLQGCYNPVTNLMDTDINQGGDLPLSQPYSTPPWDFDENITVTSFPADAVDWIYLELRDPDDPLVVVEKSAGILMEDGTIYSNDFTGYPSFEGLMPLDSYYLVAWHRNHFPVMSKDPVQIPNPITYNFSDTLAFPCFGCSGKAAIELENGVFGMIGGDVNNDGVLKYSGPLNDRAQVLDTIVKETGEESITNTLQGYYPEDINMDHFVKYSGNFNDPSLILLNLISLTNTLKLTSVYECIVPGTVFPPAKRSKATGPIDLLLNRTEDYFSLELMLNEKGIGAKTDNIQFTIAYDNPAMEEAMAGYSSPFKIEPQGAPVINGSLYYQTFAMVDWVDVAGSLNNGKTEILRIPSPGLESGIAVSDDAFTRSINGSYYISVAGSDMTGRIIHGYLGEYEQSRAVKSLKVFPNPSRDGHMTLSLSGFAPGTYDVFIYGISGKVVFIDSFFFSDPGPLVCRLECSGLPPGEYLLNVSGLNGSFTRKLLIMSSD